MSDYAYELAEYTAGRRAHPPCEVCAGTIVDGAITEATVCAEHLMCPCGHTAEQHPIVWHVAGDASTSCRADGCRCLDYDGPEVATIGQVTKGVGTSAT